MGEYILEKLFDGDVVMWGSRSRASTSFRALCADERLQDLGLTRKTLSNWVRAYMVTRRLGDLVDGLGLAHRYILDRCLKGSDQRRIAKLAVKHAWTARRVQDAVREANAGPTGGRTRDELPPVVLAVHHLRQTMREIKASKDGVAETTDTDVRWMYGTLSAAKVELGNVLKELAGDWQGRGHEDSPHPGEAAIGMSDADLDELLDLVTG